jgi:hypothetical protein
MPSIDHVLVGLKSSLYYALAYNVDFRKILGSKYSWDFKNSKNQNSKNFGQLIKHGS